MLSIQPAFPAATKRKTTVNNGQLIHSYVTLSSAANLKKDFLWHQQSERNSTISFKYAMIGSPLEIRNKSQKVFVSIR